MRRCGANRSTIEKANDFAGAAMAHLRTMLLILSLLCLLPSAAAQAPEGDAVALLGVLKGLRKSGSYGRLKGSWRPGTDPCAGSGWEGVSCDEAGEAVTVLPATSRKKTS
jgi:hypothetical protein